MTKYGFAFVYFIFGIVLASCAPSGGQHSHFDQRPTEVEVKPATLTEQVIGEDTSRPKRDLEIRQHLFDFLTTLKPHLGATYTKVTYTKDEPIEFFVGHRCESLINKLADTPKSPTNLYDKLVADVEQITHKDLATAACDGPTSYFTVIPGKLISRSYSERNILDPDIEETVEITLRPDNTVAAYHISEGVTKDNRSTAAFIQNEAVITQYSENDFHEVFSSLNSRYEKTTIDAVDGSFSFQQEDIPYGHRSEVFGDQRDGTLKKLQLKSFEDKYDLNAEEFVATYHTPLIGPEDHNPPVVASCEITLNSPGSTEDQSSYRVNSRQQCFPEYRW